MTSIVRHFGGQTARSYSGAQASPAAFREAAPEQFSLVHFTAHATANRVSPLDSAVILSGPDDRFKLYARDVAELPLRAELVTVSACRSAGERVYSGEGLVGFAWAFLRAGARRVIAGLWDVDDRSTAELMDRLYARLAAGESPPRALRQAKLALMSQGGVAAKPYYWAPFQVFTVSPD
jgi:CHAT domain-containing protein